MVRVVLFFVFLLGNVGSAAEIVSQFTNGKFHNSVKSNKSLGAFLKMRMNAEYAKWPKWVESIPGPAPAKRVEGDNIVYILINHSTVLIQAGGFNILTDPIYSKRCSPVTFAGPQRVRNPGITFEDLPKIDVIIISHNHYDHLDLPTINKIVSRDNPKLFMGLGVSKSMASKKKVFEMDWWQRIEVANNFTLTFVPVQHFSGRGLFDRNKTLWGGYVLEIAGNKIYFGGDSGYADHYKQTYEKFGAMDLSFLPIGAYAPRDFMAYAHMDPKQSVQAHRDLRSKKSIGMHYGTFQLTAEAIDEPAELLRKEAKIAGLSPEEFTTIEFGKAFNIERWKEQLEIRQISSE